jgi:adenine-specific DNA methylase
MHSYPKRLIEVDLPIKQISAHARREKSIRHGHISTLHIWWARRPLAACRAVICAALWPDPADPLCPPKFREDACRLINAFAAKAATDKTLAEHCSHDTWKKWQALSKSDGGLDFRRQAHWNVLRFALLDFIADFANWDNSTVSEYLETSRALTQAAHEAMGGAPGTRPLVMDPFAGGGSMPIEALRVGADAFASDLNPVAVLLNKVVLEYIPRYGQRLADEVRKWGDWMRCEAEKELAEIYPKDADGATPIAYLWARTIQCEGPGCGAEIPLIRNLQLTRKGRKWHLRLRPDGKTIQIDLAEGDTAENGTVRNGSATCPCCNYTTLAKSVKTQLSSKRGGSELPRLLAVYVEGESRYFRSPLIADTQAFTKAAGQLDRGRLPTDKINPVRPYKNSRGVSAVTRIGITTFGDLYTPRQALALITLQDIAFRVANADGDPAFNRALATLLHFVVSRYVFQNCALSRWNATGAKIEGAFGKQALQVVWDFAEANPFSNGSANWNNALDWVVEVVEANLVLRGNGTVDRAAAQDQILPDNAANLLATDPPYFAAIPYSDLANVFYVWERELLRRLYPEMYKDGLIDQSREIIVTNANCGPEQQVKSPEFFSSEMTVALEAARRSLAVDGVGVIVFADSSTSAWEAILGAIIGAGWTVTSSWPIDTEMQNRTQAQESASLQSSVHIVCRPREKSGTAITSDMVGDWRDVLRELPPRIHEWMPRLAAEGVVGADAIFACLGPALEIFSRYSRVEKANGDTVTLKEYLEQVWAAVAKEALTMIFTGADTSGFEEDARLTAMWLWTLNAGKTDAASGEPGEEEESDDDSEGGAKKAKTGGFVLEYDAARKIAQGLGAHLEDLGSLVEVSGEQARLLPVGERARHLFGKDEGNVTATKKKKKIPQLDLFKVLEEVDGEETISGEAIVERHGKTVLDRIHQSMILFAAGRSEALKRFLVEEGVGRDQHFWSLAQALSALYPTQTSEKRWIDGVLARKKGLGF